MSIKKDFTSTKLFKPLLDTWPDIGAVKSFYKLRTYHTLGAIKEAVEILQLKTKLPGELKTAKALREVLDFL